MQPYTVVAEKGTMESNLFTPGTEKRTTPNAAYIMMILNTFVHNVEPEIAEGEEMVLKRKEQETISTGGVSNSDLRSMDRKQHLKF